MQLLTLGACARVTVQSFCVCILCVCVSVTALAATYPRLYVENPVSLGFLCCFLHLHCVDFDESASFKSYGWMACQHAEDSIIQAQSLSYSSKFFVVQNFREIAKNCMNVNFRDKNFMIAMFFHDYLHVDNSRCRSAHNSYTWRWGL